MTERIKWVVIPIIIFASIIVGGVMWSLWLFENIVNSYCG